MNILFLFLTMILIICAADSVSKERYLLGVLEFLGSLSFLVYEINYLM